MRRQDVWKKNYRKNRYLRHLNADELQRRGADAINANVTLTLDGKVGFLDISVFGSEAIERFTHFMEECRLRGMSHESTVRGMELHEVVPDLPGALGQRAAKALADATRCHKSALYKFGKAKHFRPLLEKGELRISAASSFSDPKHNKAAGDNEVSRAFRLAIKGEKILEVVTEHGLPEEIANRDDLEINIDYFTDYWMTCFAANLQPRMAVDFEADAMLAVFDQAEFRRRLRNAFRREVSDYLMMQHGPVQYFDPYLPKANYRAIPLIKPFKYYYQQEYRFYWLPAKPTNRLDQVDVKMGDLSDIAELVTW